MSEREQMQEQKMPVVAVVLAAGFGTRFDENNPKQLVSVGDKPIVCWSIEAFERNDRVSDIIVVVNERVSNMVNMLIDEAGYTKVRAVIPGGSERVDSTRAALDLLKQAGIPDGAKILIHDSVRPFVEQQSIDGCIDSLDQFNAATVAYASTDTILLTEDLGERKVVRSVPDRTNAFRAQTPQAFRFGTITKAYELAEPVAIVAGSETNLKITTQADMPIAENIARSLDPEHAKQEAKARMHAVFAEAFSQMHKH